MLTKTRADKTARDEIYRLLKGTRREVDLSLGRLETAKRMIDDLLERLFEE